MNKAKKTVKSVFAVLLALVLITVGLPISASAAETNNVTSRASYTFPKTLYATSTVGFGAHNIKLNTNSNGTGTSYQAFCSASNKLTPGGNRTYTLNRMLNPSTQKDAVILRALYYGFGGKGYADHNTTKWVIQWAETGDYFGYDANFFKLCGVVKDSKTGKLRYATATELKNTRVTISRVFNSNNVASNITPITVSPIIDGSELLITPSKTTLTASNKLVSGLWQQQSEAVTINGSGSVSITVPTGYHFCYNGTTYNAGKHTINAGYSGYIWCNTDISGTATITGEYTKDSFAGAVYYSSSTSYQPLVSRVMIPITETASFSFKAAFNGGILLQLNKVSSNPDMTNGNACYSLAGAIYNIYTSESAAQAASKLIEAGNKADADKTRFSYIRTNDTGFGKHGSGANGQPVPLGTYYAVERDASEGYLLDKTVYEFKDTGKTADGIPVYKLYDTNAKKFEVKETPDNDPVIIVLQKRSARNENAGERLAGAEYVIEYYDGFYTEEELKEITSTRRWVVKTDKDGIARLSQDYLVSGDEFYYSTDSGNQALPLGTVKIYETKAPEGFLINDTPFVSQITGTGGAGTSQFNYPTFEEPEVSINTSATVNSVFESTSSTITDTVIYSLEPNTDYTVTGWLVKKSSGAVVPLTGSDGTMSNNKVTKSFRTTADGNDGNGSVSIKYNFNSTGYGGETVVAFAEVRNADGAIVGEHKDINSKDQSIQFKTPGIATSAICYNSNSRYIYPYDDVYITDTISFQNLARDTYAITPKAMLISKDGKSVEKELPITIDSANVKALSGNGSVDVEFTINSTEFLKIVGNDESRLNELNDRKIVIFETLTGANGNVFKHEDMNDIAQTLTMITPTVTTKASDSVSKLNKAYVSKNTTIYDEVTIDGLVPGQDYCVRGFVIREASGGTPIVEKEECFTATAKTQTFKMSYTFDSSKLGGETIYCSAYVYAPDGLTQIAIHSGANDTAQQVEFLSPTISTTANAPSTDSQYAYGVSDLQIDDTVNLKGLIPNEAYSVIGQLVDKSTGKVLTTSTEYITANGAAQNVNMSFKLNASGYSGKDVVVYETLYYKGKLVAEHKNLDDTAQTISILAPTVKTKASGDTSISDNSEIKDAYIRSEDKNE